MSQALEVAPGIALGRAVALGELLERHGGDLGHGLAAQQVARLVRPVDARFATDLVPVMRARHRQTALESPATLLCDRRIAAGVPDQRRWVVDDPRAVLASILRAIESDEQERERGADLDGPRGASRISEGVRLGEGAVVHAGAHIGRGCVIGDKVVIHRGVRLGREVVVGASTVLGAPGFGWTSGDQGRAIRMPHLAGVVVEDDVEIGALCTVDAGVLAPTRIGRGSRLDSQVHVAHNVEIGPHCMVAAQVGFAGSVVLGRGVLVGGQAGFADGVEIGAGARVGAKSGVIGDIPAGAVVAGFPAVSKTLWLRGVSRLLGARRSERQARRRERSS